MNIAPIVLFTVGCCKLNTRLIVSREGRMVMGRGKVELEGTGVKR